VVEDVEVYPVRTLSQGVALLNETLTMAPHELNGEVYEASKVGANLDFAEVRGQEAVKRAITISAAGGHNLRKIATV
jgi:magnesium chelatase family protein